VDLLLAEEFYSVPDGPPAASCPKERDNLIALCEISWCIPTKRNLCTRAAPLKLLTVTLASLQAVWGSVIAERPWKRGVRDRRRHLGRARKSVMGECLQAGHGHFRHFYTWFYMRSLPALTLYPLGTGWRDPGHIYSPSNDPRMERSTRRRNKLHWFGIAGFSGVEVLVEA